MKLFIVKRYGKVITPITVIFGIILFLVGLIFLGVFLLFSLPILGFALYRAVRIRKHFKKHFDNLEKLHADDNVKNSKIIDIKEWKVIEDK